MAITEQTPNTIPNTVRRDRNRCSHKLRSAMRRVRRNLAAEKLFVPLPCADLTLLKEVAGKL
jgi:hypothetical protein